MAGKKIGNGRKRGTADLTVEILREIRDGMTGLRHDVTGLGDRLDQTNQRLDQTNQRLDQSNQRLERVEQGLLDLGKFMREPALSMASYEKFHAHHIELLERNVQDLQVRMRTVEERGSVR